ncbi:MAG: gamma-glutamyltransferase [Terriglobales bacterium]
MAGGNAIDAAIATAATLNLMEPMNVGIGGDLYAIVYIASENKLYQLNAGDFAPGYAIAWVIPTIRQTGDTVPACLPPVFSVRLFPVPPGPGTR